MFLDLLTVSRRSHPLHLTAAHVSSRKAMAQAGVTHKDVRFFELHDAYSIMACLCLEVLFASF